MKLKIIALCALLVAFTNQATFAKNAEILVSDYHFDASKNLPRNFRDLSELGLNAIGSGQFSEDELRQIRKKYPTEKIMIVDLRRESHGFINGKPVSWRENFDQSNLNKKPIEIMLDEKSRLTAALKNEEIIINNIIAKDEQSGWFFTVNPKLIHVLDSKTEAELAKEHGFGYRRYAVRDRYFPDENQLKSMKKFLKSLPKDTKIYVHCAAGRGRTTTFLTLYDIIKNGKNLSLEAIMERQEKIGGIRLDKIEEEAEWKEEFAKKRLAAIQKFYAEEVKN